MLKRNASAEPNVRTADEKLIRDIELAMKSYYSAALGEAIREGKRKKAQARRRPARRKRSS